MPDNVYDHPKRAMGSGSGGDGNDMNTRVSNLETRLDTILPVLATKGDVSEAKAGIVMWLSTIIVATAAIIIAVFLFAINRAIPVQPSAQPTPIIIYPQPTSPPASQSPPTTKRDR